MTAKLNIKLESTVKIGGGPVAEVAIGGDSPLALIAGPCVIESRDHILMMAEKVKVAAEAAGLPLIFKSSFDKANRTSGSGFRGGGIEEGLKILAEVRSSFRLPVVTDIHLPDQAALVAEYVDLLQIPAFLCRQTDLLEAAGRTGKPVMVKKGQFLHPSDMKYAGQKIAAAGSNSVIFCERGTSFGYRELIVDFKSLKIMSDLGAPVVFDATHSVQSLGGAGGSSSGSREYVPLLARAAAAVGVGAVFIETHDNPDSAPSDGPNMVPITELKGLLDSLNRIDRARRGV